ncbi:MAG: CAP domain-containing protein, partial [Alphaproteobacteria bacterium]
DGGNGQDRYVAAGGSRWELVAETIARCDGGAPPVTDATVEWLLEGWMNSPELRENILRPGLTRFGFGVAAGARGGLYAVQTFAGPGTPRGAGQGEQAETPLSRDEIATRATDLINAARREAKVGELRPSPALDEAAGKLLPDPDADTEALDTGGNLFRALPERERGKWRSLSVVAGACGGCGSYPTAADIRSFRNRWLDEPRYKQRLLDPNATAMGFAMQASGSGRKTAALVLGTAR